MNNFILLFHFCFLFSCFINNAQNLVWFQSAHPDSLQVNGVAFSNDGLQILSATNCHPAYIKLYNSSDGNVDWEYEVPTALYCMMGAGFSSNGNYFATIEEMGNILLFDYSQTSPESLMTITMGTSYAFALVFSPNSSKIAVGGSGGKLQTYNLQTGAQDINISAHSNWVTTVCYSSDNLKIATGGSDNKIKLWDTTGTLLQTFTEHTDDITTVKFSPDNSKLISGSKDNTVKIWDAINGLLLQTIDVSTADVNAIEISPDGKHIVSVSSDSYIRIWNLNTYDLEVEFLQDYAQPICVAWSPNEDKIVTGTSNGLVTLYEISSSLGIKNLENLTNFRIFPNPASGFMKIQSNLIPTYYTIKNIMGQNIQSGFVAENNNLIDLRSLTEGVYYFTTSSGNCRFIKE